MHFLFQADSEGNLVEIPVAPGNVFEINNVVPHQVRICNRGGWLAVSLASHTRAHCSPTHTAGA